MNKTIKIKNKSGNKLLGILQTGINKRLIIICNGYDSTKEFLPINKLADGLNKNGYSVFRFDFSGTGQSNGEKRVFLTQQVDDLNCVVNYFTKFNKLILLGFSLGALSAAIVSVTNPKVTHLITLNGYFGRGELGKEVRNTYLKYRLAALIIPKFRADYKFFKDNFLPAKIKIPVLVIYTKKDDVVYPVQSERFYLELSTKYKMLQNLGLLKHNLTGKDDVLKIVSAINI
ncbi:hypothetical protein A2774_05225 [Candidatus Roizmanbacteria bacterium RIFCSPHIGHO2_01_FULL_39_12c]|uniref:Serine aminopeptidase S33 domain-containing protein n=1 Tax=Candidatus Roizmanbacteria bacterium RIFCSPHIGHO2_01_FULL_39_12c TaxID=1802031 RepID=A0A1F7GC14_9BACT|nr:MAG: hypothetical protein A2774_05225 [Candidatus Roizmanbacteria bacterium RIFCSPHIGHO2_01_FULL_39_12c]OGK47906.1 MAG: hypothetical protein A2963_03585 [Candidatus Roizmanbacteria bacterium RIFCSPLOWO2_01_FULL_40_13]